MSDKQNTSTFVVSIVAVVSVFSQAILNLIVDLRMYESQEKVNSKPIEVACFKGRKKFFKVKTWAELKVGDIVKLYANQEVPADILILDIQGCKLEKQTCKMRGGLWDDSDEPAEKKSYPGTTNNTGFQLSDEKFIQQVSGVIKWEYNHLGFFNGTFKMENNPTAFEICMENLVKRGCYFQNANQLIGIVLNVGSKTIANASNIRTLGTHPLIVSFQELRSFMTKSSIQGQHIRTMYSIWLLGIIVCFMPLLLFLGEEIYKNNDIQRFYRFVFSQSEYSISFIAVLTSFVNMMQTLPFLMKMCLDINIIFHSYYATWDVNLVPAQLHFNHLFGMKRLATLDSILINSSAIFNSKKKSVEAFVVGNSTFFTEHEKSNSNSQQTQENLIQQDTSFDSSESDQYQLEYLPSDVKGVAQFQNEKAIQMISQQNKDTDMLNDFLFAVSLCHSGDRVLRTKKIGKDENDSNYKFKSIYPDEEAQLDFAHQFGYSFMKRNNNIVNIKRKGFHKNGYNLRVEEQILQRIQIEGEWITISIVRLNSSRTAYFQGPLSILRLMLDIESRANCEEILSEANSFQQIGLYSKAYAKREVDLDTLVKISHLKNEISIDKKSQKINQEQLLTLLARDLKLVGIIGLKNNINVRDALVLEELEKNGLKTWLISQKKAEKNMASYYGINLFDNSRKPFEIEGLSERQIEDSLKIQLKVLCERLQNFQNNEDLKESSQVTNRLLAQKSSKREVKNSKKQVQNQAEIKKNCVIIKGQQLYLILQDETLLMLFFTLTSFCSLVICNEIDPIQRAILVEKLRIYNYLGGKGSVMALVSSNHDRFMIKNADISISLQKTIVNSDIQASADISIKSLYGLTYLLFKHGSQLHRRKFFLQEIFLYRLVMTQTLMFVNFIIGGFSSTNPFPQIFFGFFIAIVAPAYSLIQSIFHWNYGYQIFHRIYGEYKINSVIDFWSKTKGIQCVFKALIDVFIIQLTVLGGAYQKTDFKVTTVSNISIGGDESQDLYYAMAMSILFYNYNRDNNVLTLSREIGNLCCFFFCIMLLLSGDPNLDGFHTIFYCPNYVFSLFFCFLWGFFKNFLFLNLRTVWPDTPCVLAMRFYTGLEDKILLEQYDIPETNHSRKNDNGYKWLIAAMHKNNLLSINKNMYSVHRSDSIDQILELINNFSSELKDENGESKQFSSTTELINKFTLKLKDVNKEQEYNQQAIQNTKVYQKLNRIKVFILGMMILTAGHVVEFIYLKKDKNEKITGSNKFELTLYFLGISILLLTHYLVARVPLVPAHILMKILVAYSLIICVLKAQLFDVQKDHFGYDGYLIFYYFAISIIAIRVELVYLAFATIVFIFGFYAHDLVRFSEFKPEEIKQQEVYIQMGVILFQIIIWFLVIYLAALESKFKFIDTYRQVKDYQKLKSISNILINRNVRESELKGRKNIDDTHTNVTVLKCEIDNFDEIISAYSLDKGLIDLLESFQSGFDLLCDQYGVEKVEQVAKNFTVCAGLKMCDNRIDQRLLGIHHSVRIVDFALALKSFVSTKSLKNGRKMQLKIGIHSGAVVSGVLGTLKPQFSLFGDTIDIADRICDQSQNAKVLISEQTQKILDQYSNNFNFLKREFKDYSNKSLKVFQVAKRHDSLRRKKTIEKQTNKDSRFKQINVLNSDNNQLQYNIIQDSVQISEQFRGISDGDGGTDESAPQHSDNSKLEQSGFQQDGSEDLANYQSQTDDIYQTCEFRTDLEIVKDINENERYHLVERPASLLKFQNKEIEQNFAIKIMKEFSLRDFIVCYLQAALNITLIYLLINAQIGKYKWVHAIWILFSILATSGVFFFRRYLCTKNQFLYQSFDVISYAVTTMLLIYCGKVKAESLTRFEQEPLFHSVILLAYFNQTIAFRVFMIIVSINYSGWIISELIDEFNDVRNMIIYLIFTPAVHLFLVFMNLEREMKMRLQFNNDRILEVETEKSEEDMGKLVPFHILAGIKNDQQIVDMLDNVTILYAKLSFFENDGTMFKGSLNVVQQLASVFNKFDEICEQRQVYKVHSFGDFYVLMSYNGKLPKEKRRNQDLQIEEAYNIILAGFDMLTVVEELQNMGNMIIRNSNLKIGIHTGKIVGALIGQNFVRYDIFGSDVKLTQQIMQESNKNQIFVSENTQKLLENNQFVYDTLDFQETSEINFQNKVFKTFILEQIIMDESEISNEYGSETYSENQAFSVESFENQVSAEGGQDQEASIAGEIKSEEGLNKTKTRTVIGKK